MELRSEIAALKERLFMISQQESAAFLQMRESLTKEHELKSLSIESLN
jgi:hypothetical protein